MHKNNAELLHPGPILSNLLHVVLLEANTRRYGNRPMFILLLAIWFVC